MQSQVSNELGPVFAFALIAFAVLVGVIFTVVILVAHCKICAKAGYSWALGLLMIVPFGNIILPLFLAFANWPLHRELRQLKQRCGGMPA